MVEEQQVGSMPHQFQPADGGMVDGGLAEDCQVEMEIMGENRPYDIAVGHEDGGFVLQALNHLLHRRDCPKLHLS